MSYEFIPLLPFAAFLILGLFGHWIKDRAHLVAVPAVIVSFILSVITFIEVAGGRHTTIPLYTWATSGELSIELRLYVDRLTAVMLLLVTIATSFVPVSTLTLICLLLFMGAMGKSAQVPLHVWLPDAMEGPTPISALIHAATMVTAGVFLVARMAPLYSLSPAAMDVVAITGAATMVLGATIALTQFDIKRIVAWSTVSQLGYMMMACGLGAYAAGIYHLLTHGAFKALLFLGCGSVILALHHEQDMRRMGGLKDKMPVTYWTFVVGSLALAGFPLTAGFFSKDEILLSAWSAGSLGKLLASLGLATALLTAFYSFRLVFVTFWGDSRVDPRHVGHVHEPSRTMTIPLLILAVLSIAAGYLGIPGFLVPAFPTSGSDGPHV